MEETDDEYENREFNTFDEKGVRVQKEKCKTCIFHPGNRMRLEAGRVKEMVDRSIVNDSAIICHATLDLDEQAVCRGFFDAHKTGPLQVAERLDLVNEVQLGRE